MKSINANKFFILACFVVVLHGIGCGHDDSSGQEQPPGSASTATPLYNANELRILRTLAKTRINHSRKKMCKGYDNRNRKPISHSYAIAILNYRKTHRDESSAANEPLERDSDVLCALESNKFEAIFLGNLQDNIYSIEYPRDKDKIKNIIEALKSGFVLGHPIVTLMFATAGHQIMGAFAIDGHFKVIDSMGGGAINIDELAAALNKARIVNRQGMHIHFSGENVGTRLQKGGNDCIRLAALYVRQIVIENDIEAYQKVNGAFVDNLLQKFEDISKIEQARKIAVVEPRIDRARDAFMESWDHRNYGLVDHDDGWKGIKIRNLKPRVRGGREVQTGSLMLWTLKGGRGDALVYLRIGQLTKTCRIAGHSFCFEGTNKSAFATNYINLASLYSAAHNPAINHVIPVDNEDLPLEAVLQPGQRKGLLYSMKNHEFYIVNLR